MSDDTPIGDDRAPDRTEFRAYQKAALQTATDPHRYEGALPLGALGLAGEAGEVVDLIKKHLFHSRPLDKEELIKEMGDVLWYLALLAEGIGTDLSVVAGANLDKLAKRFPEGKFTPEDAAAKADEGTPCPGPREPMTAYRVAQVQASLAPLVPRHIRDAIEKDPDCPAGAERGNHPFDTPGCPMVRK